MIDFFKLTDLFDCIVEGGACIGISASGQNEILRKANEKLEKALSADKFFCSQNENPGWNLSANRNQYHTHEAFLFDIKEIKKEPCKHEPFVRLEWPVISREIYPGKVGLTGFGDDWECRKCGKKLTPKWEEVE